MHHHGGDRALPDVREPRDLQEIPDAGFAQDQVNAGPAAQHKRRRRRVQVGGAVCLCTLASSCFKPDSIAEMRRAERRFVCCGIIQNWSPLRSLNRKVTAILALIALTCPTE